MSISALKIIAILSMSIDHIGYVFFPAAFWFRAVGRLAFPIFALSAAEGARFTRDRKRYISRLLLWGLISEIPFDLMAYGTAFSLDSQNVCFTLAAGVLCVYLLEKRSGRNMVGILAVLIVTFMLNTDYSFAGVLSVMIIHSYSVKGKPVKGVALACLLLSLMYGGQFYCFLVLIPVMLYSGKPGLHLKYLFYLFYPLHMLILWAVRMLMNTAIV